MRSSEQELDPADVSYEEDPFQADADTIDVGGRRPPGARRVPLRDTARRAVRWRIDPERRGALAVLAAVVVAGLAVGWQVLADKPHAEPVASVAGASPASNVDVSTPITSAAGPGAAGPAPPTAPARVIVDVVGRVHRPGLVTLPSGARVADAVRAAGGALAGTNLSSINLARVCLDGEQIAVGVPGAAAPAGTGPSGTAATGRSGAGPAGALVNLNIATADQLDALPGVGPVMAQRIIQYRTDRGPFTAVSQLQQVSGIGDAT